MYHPVTARLSTFDARLKDGIWIGQDGGGVYILLTENSPIRAKHAKAVEHEFPGLPLFRNREEEDTVRGDMEEHIDVSRFTDSESELEEDQNILDKQSEPSTYDGLNYVPAQPSTFGESGHDGDNRDTNDKISSEIPSGEGAMIKKNQLLLAILNDNFVYNLVRTIPSFRLSLIKF